MSHTPIISTPGPTHVHLMFMMAVGGVLIAVYMCVIISMNSSCFTKLCWPNLFQDHRSNYSSRSDGRYTSERSLFDTKSLGRMTVWGILLQGLFSSDNGAANRGIKQMTGHSCNINKYVLTMILLMSGDISLNPGPNHKPGSIKDLQRLTRSRGLNILHQNICVIPAHKALLEELISCQGCEQAHIIGISETHLNKHILDGEIEMEGFHTERKDRHSSKGGGIFVYVSQPLVFHRRLDLEADGIECIWMEVLFKKSKPLLVGQVYRPPNTSDYLPEDLNEKFKTMLENLCCEENEALLLGDFNCDYKKEHSNGPLKSIISRSGFSQMVTSPTRITEETESLI